MPIYEYECAKCGEVFEVMQKISDPPPKKHSCGSKRIKRVMSRSSFILKGSGWYVTDYARKGKEGKEGKEAKEAKEAKEGKKSESGSSKTDKKPSGDSSSSTAAA